MGALVRWNGSWVEDKIALAALWRGSPTLLAVLVNACQYRFYIYCTVGTIQTDQNYTHDHATYPPTLHMELDAAPKLAIGVVVRSSATGAAVFEAPSFFFFFLLAAVRVSSRTEAGGEECNAQPYAYEPAQAQFQAAHGSPSKMGPKGWNESPNSFPRGNDWHAVKR